MAVIPYGLDFQTRDMQSGQSNYPTSYYLVTLSQSSTSAPTVAATALNTAGTVTIARSGTGVYTLTTDGLWLDASNIQVTISGTAIVAKAVRTSANVITISTFAADGSTATDLGGTAYVSVTVAGA